MRLVTIAIILLSSITASAQDVTPASIKTVLDRVLVYLERATPVGIINGKTGEQITALAQPQKDAVLVKSEYRIETHEWGLTYSGMLLANAATKDEAFKRYVDERMT